MSKTDPTKKDRGVNPDAFPASIRQSPSYLYTVESGKSLSSDRGNKKNLRIKQKKKEERDMDIS